MKIARTVVARILISISYLLASLLVGFLVGKLFGESPSREDYEWLSSWWAALYFSQFMKLDLRYLWYIAGLSLTVWIFGKIIQEHTFNLAGLQLAIMGSLLFISPFLVNLGLTKIRSLIKTGP